MGAGRFGFCQTLILRQSGVVAQGFEQERRSDSQTPEWH
jgi:hypothetical protein